MRIRCVCREYDVEATTRPTAVSFAAWLRRRCAQLTALEQEERPELMALSLPPSKKVCAFSSMTSYGAHYRIDMEEGIVRHVSYDSGVAEVACRTPSQSSLTTDAWVELVRVGVLKNILVLDYGNVKVVLMVPSWVAKHTEEQPRLRRDPHGFWIANITARPRDISSPYLLPALASQVDVLRNFSVCVKFGVHSAIDRKQVSRSTCWQLLQVFFVDDKSMPGWSVVVKKEARGRRINAEDDDHCLGQEAYMEDLQVLQNTELEEGGRGEGIGSNEAGEPRGNRRRRRPADDN
jgi:hypothetical protein